MEKLNAALGALALAAMMGAGGCASNGNSAAPAAAGGPRASAATLEGMAFEQAASGPALSALAVAAEKPEWVRWAKKRSERADGKMINISEARDEPVGAPIQLAVILTTKDKPFVAGQELDYVVSIYRPDGTLDKTLPPSLCMKSGDKLGAGFMGVCDVVLNFEIEASDPKGQWVFKIDMAAPGQKPMVFGTSFEAY